METSIRMYLCLSLPACVCERVCVSVCVRARACVRACVRVRVRERQTDRQTESVYVYIHIALVNQLLTIQMEIAPSARVVQAEAALGRDNLVLVRGGHRYDSIRELDALMRGLDRGG